MTKTLLLTLLLIPAAGRAQAVSDEPTLRGDYAAEVYSDSRRKLADVWRFVKAMGGAPADLPPPIVDLEPFDLEKQSPDWTAWQTAWSAGHPDLFADWVCNYSGRKKHPEPTQNGDCLSRSKAIAWVKSHPEVMREYPSPPRSAPSTTTAPTASRSTRTRPSRARSCRASCSRTSATLTTWSATRCCTTCSTSAASRARPTTASSSPRAPTERRPTWSAWPTS